MTNTLIVSEPLPQKIKKKQKDGGSSKVVSSSVHSIDRPNILGFSEARVSKLILRYLIKREIAQDSLKQSDAKKKKKNIGLS